MTMQGMETSTTLLKVVPALLSAQSKMSSAVKDAKNPFFKSSYADLNSVREAVMPALMEEKIGVFQPTVVVNGKQYVRTLLLHESGEFLSADTEVVVAKQNDPQALGSAISYARRYGLQSFMNVAAVDDDGETAMGRQTAPKAPKTPQEAPKQETTSKPTTSSFRRPKAQETAPVSPPAQAPVPPPAQAAPSTTADQGDTGWE